MPQKISSYHYHETFCKSSCWSYNCNDMILGNNPISSNSLYNQLLVSRGQKSFEMQAPYQWYLIYYIKIEQWHTNQYPTVTEQHTTTISSFLSPSESIAIPEGAIIPPSCIVNFVSPYGKTLATASRSNPSWYFGGIARMISSFSLSYPPGTSLLMDGMELNSMAFLHALTECIYGMIDGKTRREMNLSMRTMRLSFFQIVRSYNQESSSFLKHKHSYFVVPSKTYLRLSLGFAHDYHSRTFWFMQFK